jgi:xeroderma pigmentosum group C-complementing protein
MLLKQKLPESVAEFKDNPLYVLKRHLLKFQAIYPENAKPVGEFRKELVFSRENQVTLHSRQTWLKYARTVKPYEKPYKIVKGRLKLVKIFTIKIKY